MAPAGLIMEGALVELSGLQEQVEDVAGGLKVLGTLDVTGLHAQLRRFDRQADKWLAATFDGHLVKVSPRSMRPLQAAELPSGTDFVLGCDVPGVLAEEMAAKLIIDGYCVSHILVPERNLAQMIAVASEELEFKRAPADFEPCYLGRESREKTAILDFEDFSASMVPFLGSLGSQDVRFTKIQNALAPLLKEGLGMRLTGRTNLMVRQSFADEQEEAAYPAAASASDAERESFMSLVKRRRVCIMHFLGPLTGKLTLNPRGKSGDEIEIEASPGKMVMFLTERFGYSHTCSGATTTLQTWLLGQRPEFVLGKVGGDMSVLAAAAELGPPPPEGETVVINGVATHLGGDSKDYTCYWLMLAKAGSDTFVEVPSSRWDTNVYCMDGDMQAAQVAGLAYTKHQGYVDGIEFFDAKFFGIGSAEAGSMDPNQRKTLEICYEAAAMGGHELKALQRNPKHIGVFVGISGSEWSFVPHKSDAAGCGGAEAIISNRVNFSLNLKGASQTINTACSAGLVAMHSGKLHLKYKDYDPLDGVLCCGTQLAYSPSGFIGCCSGGMLSFKGRCFTYDKSADGYGRGEGVSAVYMELSEYNPEAFATVAGSQVNQDGRSASITAPNGPSQEKCIRAAFREAQMAPPEVDCFECHGTGTALGDPIEVGAFKRIYNGMPRETPLLVTSSKTNLGHLEGGAGMAGFIKCVLQVMRAECAPNIHLREKNPHIDSEGFPAHFLSEGLCCRYDSAFAGVSSFGFGGTNAHALAYGKNNTTSRRPASLDYRTLMMNKIFEAAPPEISMSSANPEDWESSGAPLGEEKIGKMYQVELDNDGKAVWHEVVDPSPDRSDERFGLSGTFNCWEVISMPQNPRIPGLFAAELEVGESGQEFFHILGSEDPSRVFHPSEPRCPRKLSKILGPESVFGAPEDYSWCISATPGSRFRVEFHITKRSTAVTWLRIRDDRALPDLSGVN
mmetsp:Transcript_31908/g.51301  ORF Transcript_31908/g.51301 Transcript_31908/m.51301 type:complete len:960 (+) Transcript_31908:33-2912(+)